jgi:hypothetical protein
MVHICDVCTEISHMAQADPHLPVQSTAANPSYCFICFD